MNLPDACKNCPVCQRCRAPEAGRATFDALAQSRHRKRATATRTLGENKNAPQANLAQSAGTVAAPDTL